MRDFCYTASARQYFLQLQFNNNNNVNNNNNNTNNTNNTNNNKQRTFMVLNLAVFLLVAVAVFLPVAVSRPVPVSLSVEGQGQRSSDIMQSHV